jgi:hypothetical protein
LPPAILHDRSGKPLYSWRVLILPYLEQERLYEEFHLDEPWDSLHNLQLLPRMPKVYDIPPGLPVDMKTELGSTFYQAFTGKGTAFDGPDGLRMGKDFPNAATTILFVEAGEPVPWTKPVDLPYSADQPLPLLGGVFTGEGRFSLFGNNRVKGFHAGFVDGSQRFVRQPFNEQTFRDAVIRNGPRTGGDL